MTFNEILARRSTLNFIVFAAFAAAASIFIVQKGLEIIYDIEAIEDTPLISLRKQFAEENSGPPDIKKWSLYRNEKFSFEMRFPTQYRLKTKDIELAPSPEKNETVIIADSEKSNQNKEIASSGGICSFEINAPSNPSRLTLNEWISTYKDRGNVEKEEFFSVDGELAKKIVGSDLAGNQYVAVLASYRDRIFIFRMILSGDSTKIGRCRQEFDLMISTVKFIR
jgi:hypothetical protein